MKVVGHLVELDKAPVLQLVAHNKVIDRIVDALHPGSWPAVMAVAGALRPHNVRWHFQPDPSVDAAVTVLIALMVGLQDGDLIAEEACGLRPSVGDQRLWLREFQLEFIAQELAELGLDLLGLASWAGEPQQEVVSVANVVKTTVIRIVEHYRRHGLCLPA